MIRLDIQSCKQTDQITGTSKYKTTYLPQTFETEMNSTAQEIAYLVEITAIDNSAI